MRQCWNAGDVQHVVGAEGVGVDDAVGYHRVVDDVLQGFAAYVRDHFGIDLSPAFQQAKDGNLARRSASALALATAAKVGLISLYLAEQRGRRLRSRAMISRKR